LALGRHPIYGKYFPDWKVSVTTDTVEAEFLTVRDYCLVSDSVLSKTATALEAVGYLRLRKGCVGKRPRTWLAATRAGRKALGGHLTALQQLAAAAEAARAASAATTIEPTG
jgi:hypothetical protein